MSLVGALLQVAVIVGGAPLLLGLMRLVRARLEGRVGAGVAQPWRDLRRLLAKEAITPQGTGPLVRLAPVVLVATTLVVAAVLPAVAATPLLDGLADLVVVIGLLALGPVVLALAALDTRTAFGGLGAHRTILILALVEPTLLVAVLAVAVRAGTTDLPTIVATVLAEPGRVVSAAGLLAAAALVVAAIAESGRLPVDNPSTHLELTMVHEAMVLEYAGPDLALVELAGAMRLTVLMTLLTTLFVPWGVATTPAGLVLGVAALVAKLAALGVVLAAVEVFLAKLRLFRVPELLAGSFLLALLAVAASFTAGVG